MSSCIGKRKFASEHDALDALDTIRNNADSWLRDKVPRRVYDCDICGGWHLTAMTGPAGLRRKRGVIRW